MGTVIIKGVTAIGFTAAGSPAATYAIRDLFSDNGAPYPELQGRTPDTINTPGNDWAVAVGTSDKYECVASPSDHLRNETVVDGWGAGIDCGQANKKVECNIEIATSVSGTTTCRLLCRENGGANNTGVLVKRVSATVANLQAFKFVGGSLDVGTTVSITGTANSWEIVLEDNGGTLTAYDAAAPATTTTISTLSSGDNKPGVRRAGTDMAAVTDVKYRDFRVTLL